MIKLNDIKLSELALINACSEKFMIDCLIKQSIKFEKIEIIGKFDNLSDYRNGNGDYYSHLPGCIKRDIFIAIELCDSYDNIKLINAVDNTAYDLKDFEEELKILFKKNSVDFFEDNINTVDEASLLYKTEWFLELPFLEQIKIAIIDNYYYDSKEKNWIQIPVCIRDLCNNNVSSMFEIIYNRTY